jgi:hypothetical protein
MIFIFINITLPKPNFQVKLPSFTPRSLAALREIFLLFGSLRFKDLGETPSLKSFYMPIYRL